MPEWLVKSEPGSYGWDDFVREGGTTWDGVRNHAAKLHLAAMAVGDEVLFYHSGTDRAVVGIARIAGPPEADGPDGAWIAVRIVPVRPLDRMVTLAAIKAEPTLADMVLLRQPRLSVSPVRPHEWTRILELANA